MSHCHWCGVEVEIRKIGSSNWMSACDCHMAFAVAPTLADNLRIDEIAHKSKLLGIPPEPITLGDLLRANRNIVGDADC